MLDDGIDAGMDAQRERVAVSRKLLEQRVDLARAPTHDVQDRPEHLLSQIFCAVEHDDRRRHISPPRRQRLEAIPTKAHAALPILVRDPAVELLLRLGVDHRPDMGGRLARIAEIELARGAGDHLHEGFREILLHTKQTKRRAALAGRAECRGDDVVGDLLGQRRSVDDHRIDAAGFRDQRHDRAILACQRAMDGASDLGRAGKYDAADAAIRHQGGPDLAIARQ